jgi:hypothetical protein
MVQVLNSLLPKLQTNNVLRITDSETAGGVPPLMPLNQLMQMAPHQSHYLYQYVRNALYDMKQGNLEDFNTITCSVLFSRYGYSERRGADPHAQVAAKRLYRRH